MTVCVTVILSTLETECQSSATPRSDILFLGLTIWLSRKLASNIYIISPLHLFLRTRNQAQTNWEDLNSLPEVVTYKWFRLIAPFCLFFRTWNQTQTNLEGLNSVPEVVTDKCFRLIIPLYCSYGLRTRFTLVSRFNPCTRFGVRGA